MVAPRYGLEGRTVLVTGAAGGIGRALSEAFAAQGARLMLVDRESLRLHALVERLAPTADIAAAACDLNDDAAVATLAEQLRAHWGSLDVLVNNAGAEYPTPVDDPRPDAMTRWTRLMDNNVAGMMRLTRALLPLMPRGASIINQSSIWGLSAVAGFSAYVASKHAVIGLTRSLAFELAPRGVRVNAVCPGWIRTEAALRSLAAMAETEGRSEAEIERELLARQAVPTMLTPADIAGVYLFLASSDAAPLTGQSLVASHGEVMH
jgi:NAD(P)-dependent dehydrogenase (short-subunit alcohol dehydrogenase family)